MIIKTVYTQHEYYWTVNYANANTLFLFCLFSLTIILYANTVRVRVTKS